MEYSIDPVTKEKMKKNLVYVGIFSIVMFFAGLTSAYIVLMGDSFWLKYPMPDCFYVSTIIVLLSSLTFYLALKSAKKDQLSKVKIFMTLTFILGILFVVLQFMGYKDLVNRGLNPVNKNLMTVDGVYGNPYIIKLDGVPLKLNGNHFEVNNKKLSNRQLDDLKRFMKPFLNEKNGSNKKLSLDKNSKFTLFRAPSKELSEYLEVDNVDGYFVKTVYSETPSDNQKKQVEKPFDYSDYSNLKSLAKNIMEGKGDFFAKGTYGENFEIQKNGNTLNYVGGVGINERYFMLGKEKVSRDEIQNSSDSASAFLYVITCAHLLHIFFALLYLLKVTISSFSNKFNSSNNLTLKTSSIFWHFLGLLWVYLLLFLSFIH